MAMSGIHPGNPWPLGSTITPKGVNFSLAAPDADRVELVLFSAADARTPDRVIELQERRHRSGDYWHVEVEGLQQGSCYGYRVFGSLAPGGHGFRPSKILLDPAARAISGWDVYDRRLATGPSPNTQACLKSCLLYTSPSPRDSV